MACISEANGDSSEEYDTFEPTLRNSVEKPKKYVEVQTSPVSKVYVTTSTSDKRYSMGFGLITKIYEDQDKISWAVHEVVDVEPGAPAYEIGLRPNDQILELDEIGTDGMYHDDLLDQFLIIQWPDMTMFIKRGDTLYVAAIQLSVEGDDLESSVLTVEFSIMEIWLEPEESGDILRGRPIRDCGRVSRVSKQITVLDQAGEIPAFIMHRESQYYIQIRANAIVMGPLTETSTNLSQCTYTGVKSSHTQSVGQLITFQTTLRRKPAYIVAISRSRVGLRITKEVGEDVQFLNADDPRLFFRRSFGSSTCFYVAQFARRSVLSFLAFDGKELFLKPMSHCESQRDPDVHFRIMD